jgi:glycosyltransferase involved in cell wall biosynthesis
MAGVSPANLLARRTSRRGNETVKILIAAASFSPQMSGLQRHAFNLVRCLLRRTEVSQVHLVVAPWQRALLPTTGLVADLRLQTHIADMDASSLSRNLWYYRQLPALAARLRVDLLHLSFPMPLDGAAFACPTVVTLHDLYPFEIPLNFGFPKFVFNRLVLQQCLRNVDAIACVSDVTRTLLNQYLPGSVGRKASRIYNCVEAETTCAVASPIGTWQGEPFLLCVAQHRRNKNIPLLIRSFHRLLQRKQMDPRMQLVVIGIPGPESKRIHQLVSALHLDNRAHFLEGLSEPQLQWCYARSEMLVAPSITEGFGLPVAEALLAGCRVVCSDIPAFREVAAGHCRFVALKKNSVGALAEAIVASLRDPAPKPVSLPQFSASLLAKQYIKLYSTLIGAAALPHRARFAAALQTAATERHSL